MDYKKKAWIVSGILVIFLLTMILYAVHNAAVAEARASRSDSKSAAGSSGCPFSAGPQPQVKNKSCCEGGDNMDETMKNKKNNDTGAIKGLPADQSQPESTSSNPNPAAKSFNLKDMKGKNLSEEEQQALMKQFTPEELAKCPHLAAKSHKKTKK